MGSYVCVAAAVATSADADVAVDAADVAGVAFAVAVGVAAAFAVAVVVTVVVAVAVAVAAVVVAAACDAAYTVAFWGVLGVLFGKIAGTCKSKAAQQLFCRSIFRQKFILFEGLAVWRWFRRLLCNFLHKS